MDLFTEISLIVLIAAVVSVVMRLLRQPFIIGYIITGVLVGPYLLNLLKSTEVIELFSKIGITALLFIVGLGLSPKVVKDVGPVSLVTGIGQVVFTSVIGFFIVAYLGFTLLESVYIAVAITFSSTIIILKLLSDKGDVNKLYGKISIGFLLVQDLIATLLLVAISTLTVSPSGQSLFVSVSLTLVKGLLLLLTIFAISNLVLPKFGTFLAKSQELLFIFSLAWGLTIGVLYHKLGLSVEIGALVAGVSLSMTPYSYEIGSRLKPLRDFFIILFFILLGREMVFQNLQIYLGPIIILSVFILVGNPLIVLLLMNILGFKKRVGFLCGLTVAQISEFSLILMALGFKVGHVSKDALSVVTFIGIITIAGSTYLILYAEKIYQKLSRYLTVFEVRKVNRAKFETPHNFEAILAGYHRVGGDFVQLFKSLNLKFLVIDFDPESIKRATQEGVPNIYGDIEDTEFLDELDISQTKLVVSTIPDFEANCLLVDRVRRENKEAIIIILSDDVDEALKLYELGTSYVVMPHFVGAEFASNLIKNYKFEEGLFEKEKSKHREYLQKRKLELSRQLAA
ncbi:MAG: cation:proton antiporter [Patescibacteria group bacterium]|mgnify:CR=1 FL=1